MKRVNRYYDAAKAHHTPEGFRNPEPSQRREGDLQRWQDERKRQVAQAAAAGICAIYRTLVATRRSQRQR